MKSKRFFQAAAITISSTGLILPQSSLLAATPQSAATPSQTETAAPAVLDVALGQGGTLQGKVLNGQGQPVADAPVSVRFDGKEVATTKSTADGSFAVRGLRGGTHLVVSGENGGVCRMWTPETAPPSARQSVMIVRGGQVVRGNYLPGYGTGLMMAGVLGGIIAGGVISQDSSNGHGYGSGS